MKRAGQIVLVPFPFTDLSEAKLRPVLVLRKASDRFDDWLVCMISSQVRQGELDLDETLGPDDTEFSTTGLKAPSLLRLSRLAVIDGALIVGAIGAISDDRLSAVLKKLADWLVSENS
jgi:mRNA interferase MazF